MLADAQQFVSAHHTEFLILKFAKCFNLLNVLKQCQQTLGHWQYQPAGQENTNTLAVGHFGGTVLTIFNENDVANLHLLPGQFPGCIRYKELYNKKREREVAYDPNYDGVQYFGKF